MNHAVRPTAPLGLARPMLRGCVVAAALAVSASAQSDSAGAQPGALALLSVPTHLLVEAVLLATIVYLLIQKSYQPRDKDKTPLTPKEVDMLCKEWEPEPLAPPDVMSKALPKHILSGEGGPTAVVNGAEVINLASMNFLGLSCDKSVEDACVDALNKYGCGSCGPRGFYGTIDVHLELEERIAEFIGTEDAILYSYDVATPSSVVPAFAKRGDIVVCDEAVSYPLMNGIVLSRSTMHTFRHNDMQDLERVLQQIAASDKRRGRKKVTNRRFIVTEGVFAKTGDLAPLPQLVALKERYRYRLIVEDSLAVGVLGRTGRGTAEHFDIDPHRVDIITASLSNSLGSIGGFCCGTKKIVDHQRLNGLGYCFSASLPPFLASAAIAAIDRIVSAPVIVTELQDNARYFRQELCKAKGLTVDAEAPPAAVYIYVDGVEDAGTLGRIADACLARGVFLCGAQQWSPLERWLPERPCLRAFVCALHTRQQLKTAAATIGACAQKCRRK